MMALWLWATVDGVGSARQLDRLCEQHLAYRWLCGGVSMNYHTLSDFRVAHAEVLDRLLAGGVAALVEQGLVALDVLAQDGLKVRAAAGAGSFRRRERLGKLAVAAKARVERLRAELEADPAAGDRRQRAAQQRAAREQEERVKAALDRMSELEAERARREKTNKAEVSRQKEPRASTTDAEARAMKLADGGLGSGLGAPDAGRTGRCRDEAVGLPGRWRVCQERRHRMGPSERHQTVVPAGAEQAWHRSLRTAAGRQTGGGGLAPAHGQRARESAL